MENGYYFIEGNYVELKYFQEWGMLTLQSTSTPVSMENAKDFLCFEQTPEVLNPDLVRVANNYYIAKKSMHIQF